MWVVLYLVNDKTARINLTSQKDGSYNGFDEEGNPVSYNVADVWNMKGSWGNTEEYG